MTLSYIMYPVPANLVSKKKENFKFDKHIDKKLHESRKQFGMIKKALYWVPEKARLTAYKSICLPHLEYASAA